MDKLQHLKALLEFLETHSREETHFDVLCRKLLAEYESEQMINSSLSSALYLNNLRQTIEKQAEGYKAAKKEGPRKALLLNSKISSATLSKMYAKP